MEIASSLKQLESTVDFISKDLEKMIVEMR